MPEHTIRLSILAIDRSGDLHLDPDITPQPHETQFPDSIELNCVECGADSPQCGAYLHYGAGVRKWLVREYWRTSVSVNGESFLVLSKHKASPAKAIQYADGSFVDPNDTFTNDVVVAYRAAQEPVVD